MLALVKYERHWVAPTNKIVQKTGTEGLQNPRQVATCFFISHHRGEHLIALFPPSNHRSKHRVAVTAVPLAQGGR